MLALFFERLLQPLDMAGLLADQPFARAQQRAHILHLGSGGRKGGLGGRGVLFLFATFAAVYARARGLGSP